MVLVYYGSFWDIMAHFDCLLWLIAARCSSFWVNLVNCNYLGLIVICNGSLWPNVAYCSSLKLNFTHCGFLWLVLNPHSSMLLVVVIWAHYDLFWFIMANFCSLGLIIAHCSCLRLIVAQCYLLRLTVV